jgi:hypothetical protein
MRRGTFARAPPWDIDSQGGFMRLIFAPVAALALLTACGGAEPTPQEEALPETGTDPEMTANSAAAGINASSATGDTGAETPGGPVSDQGSAQGDTVPTN